jgi:hypothetical protein
MATHIIIEAEYEGELSNSEVRSALTGMDVSQSSPVDAAGRRVGTAWGNGEITLTVDGGDEDFTKKSETALVRAVRRIDGVDEDSVTVTKGGYETDDDDDDDE